MISGFVSIYKDIEGYVHLYFYPGYTDTNEHIYNDIDLSKTNQEYDVIKYKDKSTDFRFSNKKIVKINCRLVKKRDSEVILKTLTI